MLRQVIAARPRDEYVPRTPLFQFLALPGSPGVQSLRQGDQRALDARRLRHVHLLVISFHFDKVYIRVLVLRRARHPDLTDLHEIHERLLVAIEHVRAGRGRPFGALVRIPEQCLLSVGVLSDGQRRLLSSPLHRLHSSDVDLDFWLLLRRAGSMRHRDLRPVGVDIVETRQFFPLVGVFRDLGLFLVRSLLLLHIISEGQVLLTADEDVRHYGAQVGFGHADGRLCLRHVGKDPRWTVGTTSQQSSEVQLGPRLTGPRARRQLCALVGLHLAAAQTRESRSQDMLPLLLVQAW